MRKIKDYTCHTTLVVAMLLNIVKVLVEGATITNNILAWVIAIMLVTTNVYLMVKLTKANDTLKKSITPKYMIGQSVVVLEWTGQDKCIYFERTIEKILYDGYSFEYELNEVSRCDLNRYYYEHEIFASEEEHKKYLESFKK